MLRKCLRWVAITLFLGTAAPVATGVFGQFFIQAAQDKGYYEDAGQRLDAAMTALRNFVLQTWFLCIASASAGLVLGVWLDALARWIGRLRGRERSAGEADPRSARGLSNEQLSFRTSMFCLRLSTAEGENGLRRDEATKKVERTLLQRRINRASNQEERDALQGELAGS